MDEIERKRMENAQKLNEIERRRAGNDRKLGEIERNSARTLDAIERNSARKLDKIERKRMKSARDLKHYLKQHFNEIERKNAERFSQTTTNVTISC